MEKYNTMKDILNIEGLYKSFESKQDDVIKNISLSVTKGSVLAIVGESGSGKTTLTRLIAGLETPNSGHIKINDRTVSDDLSFVQPEHRNIGMIFQDYALFPHLTVEKNVAYGLSSSKYSKERVNDLLKIIGLDGYNKKYPHQLSGGQQQRIALARSLVPEPQLLIFDEPFSNLDITLKLQLRNEILEIIKKVNITAIFVTHDPVDAMFIADQIVILKNGEIIQKGTPDTIFKNPVNEYVASSFSRIILLSLSDLNCFGYIANDKKRYAIRFNYLEIDSDMEYNTNVEVIESIFLGDHYTNTGQLDNGTVINFTSKKKLLTSVTVGFNATSILAF